MGLSLCSDGGMSIVVELAELPSVLDDHPWGYLVTVGPDLRPHVLAVPTHFADGSFHMDGGRATRVNGATHPEVTMVFPSARPHGYSLVIDGNVTVHDASIEVRPAKAVLHRPAISAPR